MNVFPSNTRRVLMRSNNEKWDIGFGGDIGFDIQDGLGALLTYNLSKAEGGEVTLTFERDFVYDILELERGSIIFEKQIRELVEKMSDKTIKGEGSGYHPLLEAILIKAFMVIQRTKTGITEDNSPDKEDPTKGINTDANITKLETTSVADIERRMPRGVNAFSGPLYIAYLEIISNLENIDRLPKSLRHQLPGFNRKVQTETFVISPDGNYIKFLDPKVREIIGSKAVSINDVEHVLNTLSEIIERLHGISIETLQQISLAHSEAIKRKGRPVNPIKKIASLATRLALRPHGQAGKASNWDFSKKRGR